MERSSIQMGKLNDIQGGAPVRQRSYLYFGLWKIYLNLAWVINQQRAVAPPCMERANSQVIYLSKIVISIVMLACQSTCRFWSKNWKTMISTMASRNCKARHVRNSSRKYVYNRLYTYRLYVPITQKIPSGKLSHYHVKSPFHSNNSLF